MRIGVIGAGRMGRPVVDRLLAAGYDPVVLTRRPAARAAAEASGWRCADTVKEAVRDAEAVITVVFDDVQLRAAVLGEDGVFAAMPAGGVLVQHTTCDPATMTLLAEAGAQRGITVLDAAMSGNPRDIADGRLTVWVGGDESALTRVRPLLDSYASPVMFVGPAGDAQRIKLVNNALFVAQVGLAVDAVRLAGSIGITEERILAAVQQGSGGSRALSAVAWIGASAVGTRLAELMAKDVNVVRAVAKRAGADLGLIGDVLSSEVVEMQVLCAGGPPGRAAVENSKGAPAPMKEREELPSRQNGRHAMAEFTTRDGTQIFFKDWGTGQPIVFSHGWPLSSDDWDAQMLFFLHHGYRVIAHDRRGHGRSAQVSEGNDVDHYADDLADLVQHLDLHGAVHVGHSAGGGEVARYIGRHGETRVAKAALISAVTPSVLQTDTNPAGVPQAVFEGLQAQLAANRSVFYRAVASGPFYNFDQPGVTASEPVIANWWRQGMMGGANGQYECVSEFIRQDYTEDLQKITVPVLVMNGDGDQVVPYATSGPRAVELLRNGTLKTYAGFPHGMPVTHADTINNDLLAFIQS